MSRPVPAGSGDHGGNLLRAAARYGLPPEEFIDFSASLNPLGPPPGVIERLRARLGAGAARYPDPDATAARAALAARLGVPREAVLVTNGGAEAIHLAVRAALAGAGTPAPKAEAGGPAAGAGAPAPRPAPPRLVLPAPTFSEYARAARAVDAPVVRVPLSPDDGFRIDPDALAAVLRPGDLLFLANPNNPTGTLMSRADLERLVARAGATGATLAVDEAFLGFVAGGEALSLAARAAARPDLLVVGSLTKLYCLPGLRLGYAVATPERIAALAALQPAWSVNAPAQEALLACLEQADFAARTPAVVEAERTRLARALYTLPGLRAFPSRANYLLVDCRAAGRTAADLADALGRRGILIRDCGGFPGLDPHYFRVAVRGLRENEALVAALRDAL